MSTVATRVVVAVMGEVARAVRPGGARRAVAKEAARGAAAREVKMAERAVSRAVGRPVAGRVAAVVRAAEVRAAGWEVAAKAAGTVVAGWEMAGAAAAKEEVAMGAAMAVVVAMAVEKVAAVMEAAMVVATRAGMTGGIVAVATVATVRRVDVAVARVMEDGGDGGDGGGGDGGGDGGGGDDGGGDGGAAMAAATATGCLRWGLSQTQTQIPNRSRSPGPLIALACHLDHRLCQGLLERAVAAQARSCRNKWRLPSRHWPSRALPRSPTVRAGRVSVVACRACRGATKTRLYWPQGLFVLWPAAPRGLQRNNSGMFETAQPMGVKKEHTLVFRLSLELRTS